MQRKLGHCSDKLNRTLTSIVADGAYDTTSVYSALDRHSKGVHIVIPPRANARVRQCEWRQRDNTIRAIDSAGRTQWAHGSGHTRRRLVVTAMYRYKAISGRKIRARTSVSQPGETALACAILN